MSMLSDRQNQKKIVYSGILTLAAFLMMIIKLGEPMPEGMISMEADTYSINMILWSFVFSFLYGLFAKPFSKGDVRFLIYNIGIFSVLCIIRGVLPEFHGITHIMSLIEIAIMLVGLGVFLLARLIFRAYVGEFDAYKARAGKK